MLIFKDLDVSRSVVRIGISVYKKTNDCGTRVLQILAEKFIRVRVEQIT